MDKNGHLKRLRARIRYYGQHNHQEDGRDAYFLYKRKKVLPNLMVALTRVQHDLRRVCVDCGTGISEERLTIVPGAIRCVSCQQINEERTK